MGRQSSGSEEGIPFRRRWWFVLVVIPMVGLLRCGGSGPSTETAGTVEGTVALTACFDDPEGTDLCPDGSFPCRCAEIGEAEVGDDELVSSVSCDLTCGVDDPRPECQCTITQNRTEGGGGTGGTLYTCITTVTNTATAVVRTLVMSACLSNPCGENDGFFGIGDPLKQSDGGEGSRPTPSHTERVCTNTSDTDTTCTFSARCQVGSAIQRAIQRAGRCSVKETLCAAGQTANAFISGIPRRRSIFDEPVDDPAAEPNPLTGICLTDRLYWEGVDDARVKGVCRRLAYEGCDCHEEADDAFCECRSPLDPAMTPLFPPPDPSPGFEGVACEEVTLIMPEESWPGECGDAVCDTGFKREDLRCEPGGGSNPDYCRQDCPMPMDRRCDACKQADVKAHPDWDPPYTKPEIPSFWAALRADCPCDYDTRCDAGVESGGNCKDCEKCGDGFCSVGCGPDFEFDECIFPTPTNKCLQDCPGESACANGTDDDGDGFIDCADLDCKEKAACQPPPAGCPETFCGDGIDNDGDGLTDCDDTDCCSDPSCSGALFCEGGGPPGGGGGGDDCPVLPSVPPIPGLDNTNGISCIELVDATGCPVDCDTCCRSIGPLISPYTSDGTCCLP